MFVPLANPRARSRRAWLLDVVVVLVALGIALPNALTTSLLSGPGERTVAVIAIAAQGLPLLLRRIWPVPVFVFIAVVAVGFGLWNTVFVGGLELPIALYTIASLCNRRQALIAALVLEIMALPLSIWSDDKISFWLYITLMTSLIAAALGLGLYSATRRAYIAELLGRADRLERERTQTAELAAAGERARITREMHDIVAHHLTVMVSLSDAALRLIPPTETRAIETITTVSATGREALRDTRSLLGILADETRTSVADRSPIPDIAALESLVDQVRETGLRVAFRMQGTPATMAADAQLAAYRLIQESLTNTMKHAPAGSAAQVTLTFRPGNLSLLVEDDGNGRPAVGRWQAGRGTTGMQARIDAVGGVLTAGPRDSGGWRVTASIPIPTDDREEARS